MLAAPLNFRGDQKISDQNNWMGGGEGNWAKIKFGGDLKFKGGPKILGGHIVGKEGHTSPFLDQPP